jgi:hypothetical protein
MKGIFFGNSGKIYAKKFGNPPKLSYIVKDILLES